ncbi:MAG: DUF378 domain-containing protein [Phycisphaerales bacterium]|nr:DUF378 domain-containing protein [Phycisphaerales bacterium]
MKAIDVIAAVLLVVGGLNWGLWGLFDLDIVASIMGGDAAIGARLIYVLVGAAALYQAMSVKSIQMRWNTAATA